MDVINYSKIVKVESDLNQVKNLDAPAVISGTYSGTTLSTVSVSIPAGEYTLEIDKITSSDADAEVCAIIFVYSSSGSLSVRLPRGTGIKRKVKFTAAVTTMYLYASDGYALSSGDTFTYTGLKIVNNYPLRQEMYDISETIQGLSGTSFSYANGDREFKDNILAYIGSGNKITLASNSPSYATYVYKISEATSFMVTGHTRGASNYLAIATDDSGNCLQLVEQGVASTTTTYTDFVFSIDDQDATTVYICLYKDATDDVRIGIDKNTKELSILFVGNSLTQDGISYLPYLLTKYYPGFKFRFYMWYNGGYDLSQQYAKFTADTACECFSIAENVSAWTNTTAKMSDILTTYKFNIVCMQEYFNRKETYTSLTDWNNCRDYIKTHYTGGNGLEFISLFHSPWMTNEETVYDLIKTGNTLILKNSLADDMIATGIALHMARDTSLDSLGDQEHLTPDGVHAQEGLPCLLETYTALLWVLDRYGFPTSIYGLPFKMTSGIQSGINVPGANLGTGVIEGTDAQNLLAQEVAVIAYKEGKRFVENVVLSDELSDLRGDINDKLDSPSVAGTSGQVLTSDGHGGQSWQTPQSGGSVSPYTSNPAALGTASPGSSDNYARGDHVHAMPTAANVGAEPATVVTNVSGTTPSITANENTRYICGEILSLSFTPCNSGICDVRFTSGSTATVLTVPNTVKFPDWFDATTLKTNTIYEINILDGVYGVVMSWAV